MYLSLEALMTITMTNKPILVELINLLNFVMTLFYNLQVLISSDLIQMVDIPAGFLYCDTLGFVLFFLPYYLFYNGSPSYWKF